MAVVTFTLGLIVIGGLAANALLLFSLVGVALGGQGSHVSKSRRLPQDSDAKLFRLLFVIGAVIGCGFAYLGGFADWVFAFPTGAASFVVGSIIAYRTCVKLNDGYLQRAYENLERGDFRGAIEDAKEVARSSEVLRAEAKSIVAKAEELRREQPLPIGDPMASTTGTQTPTMS